MSTDNVTAIREDTSKRPTPAGRTGLTAKQKAEGSLLLCGSDEFDGFSTLDLVAGLNGVCQAIDMLAGECDDRDVIHRLGMASKILSTMVNRRVEI